MRFVAFTDGASRGNPGESGIGFLVKDEEGGLVASGGGYIGSTTNNVAEYTALLTLLKRARDFRCKELIIHSDSELLVRQINGDYKVKAPELKKFHTEVLDLLKALPFLWVVKYIPRALNKEADTLANRGIDSREAVTV